MAIIDGNDTSETLTGTAGADTINGNGGNDRIVAGMGNDTYHGGTGADTVDYSGFATHIVANLSTGTATAYTPLGQQHHTLVSIQHLVGGASGDTLTGNDEANVIAGGGGNDTLSGNGGNDTLSGGDGGDAITAGDGNDVAFGGIGADAIMGGDGNDILIGEDGADMLFGGNDQDTLDGGSGNDRLRGDAGDDVLSGGAGDDVMQGGAGHDTMSFTGSQAAVQVDMLAGTSAGQGNDVFEGIEEVIGTSHGDWFRAGATTEISAGGGNDFVISGSGANLLSGGDGTDTVSYTSASSAVSVNLGAGTASDGDTLILFENASGSSYDDTLRGGLGNNRLDGGMGADTLYGGGGNDVLNGGHGGDHLYGEGGADRFEFSANNLPGAFDYIHDFRRADGDKIDVSKIPGNLHFGDADYHPGEAAGAYSVNVEYGIDAAFVWINTDMDASIDVGIVVTANGNGQLTASDFVF